MNGRPFDKFRVNERLTTAGKRKDPANWPHMCICDMVPSVDFLLPLTSIRMLVARPSPIQPCISVVEKTSNQLRLTINLSRRFLQLGANPQGPRPNQSFEHLERGPIIRLCLLNAVDSQTGALSLSCYVKLHLCFRNYTPVPQN